MNEGPKHPGQGKEYWKAVDIYEKGKNDAQSDVIDIAGSCNENNIYVDGFLIVLFSSSLPIP